MWIYKIHNIQNDKVYIGQTTFEKIENRWKDHKCKLRKGTHINEHLQRAWNKYGAESFQFKVLRKLDMFTPQVELDRIECYYMKKFDCMNMDKGYNIRVGGSRGKQSESTKKKVSDSLKKFYIAHPEARERVRELKTGVVYSEETKQKMRKSKKRGAAHHNTKFSEKQVLDIREKHGNGESARSLARLYKVNKSSINGIVQRKTWTHI